MKESTREQECVRMCYKNTDIIVNSPPSRGPNPPLLKSDFVCVENTGETESSSVGYGFYIVYCCYKKRNKYIGNFSIFM